MKIKWVRLAVLYVVVLLILYTISLGIYLFYRYTAKSENKKIELLSSTNLSLLSFNGYKVGMDISVIPYEEWESNRIPNLDLFFENGERNTLYNFNGKTVNSKLKKIGASLSGSDNVIVYYNGIEIENKLKLSDFFGENYIDIPPHGGNSRLLVYIDHDNGLKLTLDTSDYNGYYNRYARLEKADIDSYEYSEPESIYKIYSFVRAMGYNPILVSWTVCTKMGFNYTIFESKNYRLSNSELIVYPFYYSLVCLPLLALIVFRNKRMIIVNAVLVIVNIASFILVVSSLGRF